MKLALRTVALGAVLVATLGVNSPASASAAELAGASTEAFAAIDISPGLFVNNGFFGSNGSQIVGVGIHRSDTGQFLCGVPPISALNVQLVGAATATQVRIQDGSRVLAACPKPTT